jgi:hypothetical protein
MSITGVGLVRGVELLGSRLQPTAAIMSNRKKGRITISAAELVIRPTGASLSITALVTLFRGAGLSMTTPVDLCRSPGRFITVLRPSPRLRPNSPKHAATRPQFQLLRNGPSSGQRKQDHFFLDRK